MKRNVHEISVGLLKVRVLHQVGIIWAGGLGVSAVEVVVGAVKRGRRAPPVRLETQRTARGPGKQESAVSWPPSRGLGETRFSVARS